MKINYCNKRIKIYNRIILYLKVNYDNIKIFQFKYKKKLMQIYKKIIKFWIIYIFKKRRLNSLIKKQK